MNQRDRAFAREYAGCRYTPENEIHWEFIRLALASVARLAVIPVQDYLGADTSARTNEPSTLGKNWRWRMSKSDLDEALIQRCRRMAKIYGRLGLVS